MFVVTKLSLAHIMVLLQVKNHPVKPQPPDQAGTVILAKQPVLQVCSLTINKEVD